MVRPTHARHNTYHKEKYHHQHIRHTTHAALFSKNGCTRTHNKKYNMHTCHHVCRLLLLTRTVFTKKNVCCITYADTQDMCTVFQNPLNNNTDAFFLCMRVYVKAKKCFQDNTSKVPFRMTSKVPFAWDKGYDTLVYRTCARWYMTSWHLFFQHVHTHAHTCLFFARFVLYSVCTYHTVNMNTQHEHIYVLLLHPVSVVHPVSVHTVSATNERCKAYTKSISTLFASKNAVIIVPCLVVLCLIKKRTFITPLKKEKHACLERNNYSCIEKEVTCVFWKEASHACLEKKDTCCTCTHICMLHVCIRSVHRSLGVHRSLAAYTRFLLHVKKHTSYTHTSMAC